MNLSIYLAFKNLFPSRQKITFFTIMSVIGVALGVSILIVVQSVMNGFQSDIKKNLVQSHGEIRVEGKLPIENIEYFSSRLKKFSEISSFAPYIGGMVMLMNDGQVNFSYVKGITEAETTVTGVLEMMKYGNLYNLKNNGIIISEGVAHQLGVTLGGKIEVYSPLSFEGLLNDEVIFPHELEVIGLLKSNSGMQNVAICSLEIMQNLYMLEDVVHGFTIKLKENISTSEFSIFLQDCIGDRYIVTDWEHANGDLLFALRWEKTMMFFVLLFILLIASFSISSMLITNVVRKFREIGVLIALGGSTISIAINFCLQGILVGIFGIVSGVFMGVGILHYRDGIIEILYKYFSIGSAQNYLSQFTHLPVEYHLNDFVMIFIFTMLICFLSGLIPAIKSLRINPGDSLRYER